MKALDNIGLQTVKTKTHACACVCKHSTTANLCFDKALSLQPARLQTGDITLTSDANINNTQVIEVHIHPTQAAFKMAALSRV